MDSFASSDSKIRFCSDDNKADFWLAEIKLITGQWKLLLLIYFGSTEKMALLKTLFKKMFLYDHKIFSVIIIVVVRMISMWQLVVDVSFWILHTMILWHWIKVDIDSGYCYYPTHFQTRGSKVQQIMFLLFVDGELVFHLIVVFLMNS